VPSPDISARIPVRVLAGLYWDSTTGGLHRFFEENGQLVLDGGGEGRFPLAPLGNNAYRLTAAPRRFVFTFVRRPGVPIALEVDVEGSPLRTYVRVPEAPRVAPLGTLAGTYYSRELDVTWTLVLRAGKLALKRPRVEPSPLTNLFGDVYQSENGFVLEFSRDKSGKPVSLDVTTERVRRLRFIRGSGA
jgi:hypothetical protein